MIFNEDDERQREAGEYLKTKKRCKTALVTELVQTWMKNGETGAGTSTGAMSIDAIKKAVASRQGVFVRNREINGRNKLSRSRGNRAGS